MVTCLVEVLAFGITGILRTTKTTIMQNITIVIHIKNISSSPYSELLIYHQNIRGLGNKIGEFETLVLPLLPQIICLSEHHLRTHEIGNISVNQYLLGAFYCRTNCKFRGVSIFVHESLTYSNIDVNRYCHDYDFEACALKIKTRSHVYCIACIYRPPAADLSNFLQLLDSMLTYLHSPSTNLIICGDVNINYLQSSSLKNQLDSVLALYNLYGVVDFPTRISESTCRAIDNFFMDKGKNAEYTINPIYNGLSDHDAQLLALHDTVINNQIPHFTIIRQINDSTIAQFNLNLSYENWTETFTEDSIDTNFKTFLNTYIRIFNCSFPYK
jgi:hypothetical protein